MNALWRGRSERGSSSAIRLIIWLALHAGRSLCRILLVPISIYFYMTAPESRRASREFLRRALDRPATWLDVLRHLFVYATTLLDRIYLVHGRQRELSIEVVNESAFSSAMAGGRGCLLLGSHLGSFEMLGVVGSVEKDLAINMVMHVDGGAGFGGLVHKSQVALPYKIIPLGRPGSMLRVKECLERGEVVGILADRVYADEVTRTLPFLGHPARFSMSPLRVARITGAPVLTVFGLFHGGCRYEIVFETLAAADAHAGAVTSVSPSGSTAVVSAIQDVRLDTYVANLERHARRCPYNWFNFYDYWSA